jgi:hypothetical protein
MTYQAINCRQDRKLDVQRNAKRLADYRAYANRKLNKKEPKKPSIWKWELFEEHGILESFTRSEARAQLKERFNIKRVPKEVVLRKVER